MFPNEEFELKISAISIHGYMGNREFEVFPNEESELKISAISIQGKYGI